MSRAAERALAIPTLTRAVPLLRKALGQLAMLPAIGERAPWVSDEDWRDRLLFIERGHLTDWMRALPIGSAGLEHQLHVYHAGSFLTPPRPRPVDVAMFSGWQVVLEPRPPLLS